MPVEWRSEPLGVEMNATEQLVFCGGNDNLLG